MLFRYKLSRPAWGAWIEIGEYNTILSIIASRPAWGAWIEMSALSLPTP